VEPSEKSSLALGAHGVTGPESFGRRGARVRISHPERILAAASRVFYKYFLKRVLQQSERWIILQPDSIVGSAARRCQGGWYRA